MKIIYIILLSLLLVSCWEKQINRNNIEKVSIDSQTSNKNYSQTWFNNISNPNNIIEYDLNENDKKRLNLIISKENENIFQDLEISKLNNDIKNLESEINELKTWKYLKRKNDWTTYNLTDFKKIKLEKVSKIIANSTWELVEEWETTEIENEIYLTNYNIKNSNINNFSTSYKFDNLTWENKIIIIPNEEAEKKLNNFLEWLNLKINTLIIEKETLNNWNLTEDILYENQDTIVYMLKMKENQLAEILDKKNLNIEIDKTKKLYISELWKLESEFNIKEVNYVFSSVLEKNNINENNFINLETKQIKQIIKDYESWELVKITKKIDNWLNITNNNLYLKIKNDKGINIYVDETFYLKAKNSINNGYNDFLVYTKENDNNNFYYFLTWYDKNNSYFLSLSKNLLNNIDNNLFYLLTTSKLNNSLSYQPNIRADIMEKWLILIFFKTINSEIEISWYTAYQLKSILEKIL